MSGTQYNQDPSQFRPEHRLHETNEPLQSSTGKTDMGIPPTGQHYDPTLGRTAGAGYPDENNTTQARTAGAGILNQYNTTQGRTAGASVPGEYNTTQGRTAGAGVPGEYNTTQGRTAGAGVPDDYNTTQGRTAGTGFAGQPGQQYDTYFVTSASSNRPLNVRPLPQGGVAFGGQSDLPLGYADMGDKIIGKTQKVMGKMTNNPELHEKGELRESGGKAAVHGLARVPGPHD